MFCEENIVILKKLAESSIEAIFYYIYGTVTNSIAQNIKKDIVATEWV